jgi:hypothetical protein
MSSGSRFVRSAFALLAAGGLYFGGSAAADGDNDRPAFIIVSVTPEFDLDPNPDDLPVGSPVVIARIGTYIAGDSIKSTRFDGRGQFELDLSNLPPDPSDPENDPDFNDNQFTIVGSFKTLDPDATIHVMTPYPDVIPAHVQEAFFNASPFLEDFIAATPFPTTVQIAQFIVDNQGDMEVDATLDEVLDGMFSTESSNLQLVCESPCEAEGVLFPHDPDAEPLNNFHSLFDPENGIVDVDVCLPIAIDIKPNATNNPVNLGSNGLLPVAVLTTDDFDAENELDPSTMFAVLLDEHGMVVGDGVPVDRWSYQDVDGDGDTDVMLKFSTPDLVEGDDAPLNEDSTSLEFVGETFNGMCVEGSDAVLIVDD